MFLRGDGIGGGAGLFGIRGTNTVSVRVLNCDFYDFDHDSEGNWTLPSEFGGAIGLFAPNKSYGGGGTQDTLIVSGNRMVGPGENQTSPSRSALELHWISGGSNRYVEFNDNAAVEWGTGVKLTECRDFGLKCNRLQDNRTGVDWGRSPSVDPEVALRENLVENSEDRGVRTESDIGNLAMGAPGTLPADRGRNRIVIDNGAIDHYVTQNGTTGFLPAQNNQWLDEDVGSPETDEAVIRAKCDGADTFRVLADPTITTAITACWPALPDSSPTGGPALGALAVGGPESAPAPDVPGDSQAGPEGSPLVPVAGPSRTGIDQVRPNPSRGSFEFVLGVVSGDTGRGEVDIYDVTGRRVRALWRGAIEPGWRTILWDGRDGSGQATAAGIYFVQFRLEHREFTKKLVRVAR
jgi:hypothetical protein